MTPIFSWLANLATGLQRPTVIAAVVAMIAGVVSALVPKIRYTARVTGIVLWVIGILTLAWGALLNFARSRYPSVKVPPTALRLLPVIGAILLLTACCLRWMRKRAINKRIQSLAEVNAEHIRILQHELGLAFAVDQMTDDGELMVSRLMSLVRRRGKARRIIVAGELGAGKTTTLLKFASVCGTPDREPVVGGVHSRAIRRACPR